MKRRNFNAPVSGENSVEIAIWEPLLSWLGNPPENGWVVVEPYPSEK